MEFEGQTSFPEKPGRFRVTPIESLLRSVGRGPALLLPPVSVFLIPSSRENDSVLQRQLTVDVGIEFDTFRQKNELGLPKASNSAPDHDAPGKMFFSTLIVREEPSATIFGYSVNSKPVR
ncbi:hypothetical protein HPB49_003682 [Dermacentor silvarum]|uniref:Uncharacterized protein n=1 Tax=Dermacentor silvarum TaxID=543639 RepID=A0ACB8DTH9_DERSI|nr:hypothetical protein HPB49_003682 [Dermacentor silvarum]